MKDDSVGTTKFIQGTMDGVKYSFFNLKEPEYIMKMMASYGNLAPLPYQTDSTAVSFNYPEVFGNHFRYRHMVDDHNHIRHSIPSIEGCWST